MKGDKPTAQTDQHHRYGGLKRSGKVFEYKYVPLHWFLYHFLKKQVNYEISEGSRASST